LLGYEKLKSLGLPEEICRIAERHVGAGILKDEAKKLGLPEKDFIPETIEEIIVAYADNLVDDDRVVPYEKVLQEWVGKFGEDSGQVRRLELHHSLLEDFVTSAEMGEIDAKSVEAGVPVKDLMENAGKRVAEILDEKFKLGFKEIAVFCGPGNNGGDGFVAARYLKEFGANVQVYMFREPKSSESWENFEKLGDIPVKQVTDLEDLVADIVVDALLGTGVEGDIRRLMESVIKKVNEIPAYVLSVDIPTGINPDTGEKSNVFVDADWVVCLHKVKKGLLNTKWVSKLDVVDIGIPKDI
jgi:hydroxyethylthiazole kinase-like uncharacterized protein yjeF